MMMARSLLRQIIIAAAASSYCFVAPARMYPASATAVRVTAPRLTPEMLCRNKLQHTWPCVPEEEGHGILLKLQLVCSETTTCCPSLNASPLPSLPAERLAATMGRPFRLDAMTASA